MWVDTLSWSWWREVTRLCPGMHQLSATCRSPCWIQKERELSGGLWLPLHSGSCKQQRFCWRQRLLVGSSLLSTAELTAGVTETCHTVQGREPLRNLTYCTGGSWCLWSLLVQQAPSDRLQESFHFSLPKWAFASSGIKTKTKLRNRL